MFFIRTPNQAFKDFMDPSVLFIFASIMIGLVFTKTGLTKRLRITSYNVCYTKLLRVAATAVWAMMWVRRAVTTNTPR